jgi:Tfp pilus assembly protein PilZ
MGSEQRQFDRANSSFAVQCRRVAVPAELWQEALVVNFSAGGVGLQTGSAFGMGEQLEVEIRLPSAPAPLVVQGRVVRAEPPGAATFHYGLEFTDVTPDQRAEIDALVQFLRKGPARS